MQEWLNVDETPIPDNSVILVKDRLDGYESICKYTKREENDTQSDKNYVGTAKVIYTETGKYLGIGFHVWKTPEKSQFLQYKILYQPPNKTMPTPIEIPPKLDDILKGKSFSEQVTVSVTFEYIHPHNFPIQHLESEDFKGWILDKAKNFGYGYHCEPYELDNETYTIHFNVSFK